jgi:valyl-tRNA synthetase
VQTLKPQLIAENEKINWYPERLKRPFWKRSETAPDWNISFPLLGHTMPVWVAADGTRVIGSFDELKMGGTS